MNQFFAEPGSGGKNPEPTLDFTMCSMERHPKGDMKNYYGVVVDQEELDWDTLHSRIFIVDGLRYLNPYFNRVDHRWRIALSKCEYAFLSVQEKSKFISHCGYLYVLMLSNI